MQGLLVAAYMIGVLAYSGFAIFAAYLGLANSLSLGWSIGILVISLFFRFSLPIVVGAFLGALHVWHWHWALALLFAAPGLAFMIPSVVAALMAALPWKRNS